MPEETDAQVVEETTVQETVPEELQPSQKPAELPEDASERTKREFEKLKEHNKQLKEKLNTYEKPPSVLDAYRPSGLQNITPPSAQQFSNLNQTQVNQAVASFVDENGYVDVAALNSHLERANAQARAAEQRALVAEQRANRVEDRVSRFEVTQQTERLYQSFPELDPDNSAFDGDAYDLVSKELLDQLVKTGEQDAMKAANKMSRYFRTKKEEDANRQQAIQARDSATSIVGSGKPTQPRVEVTRGPIKSTADLKARLEAAGL